MPDRNTGWEFDIVATDAERDDHGLLPPLAQLGPYDTRHRAIGMAVLAARLTDRSWDDYEIRAHQSLWREREEPAICNYCGYEEEYAPLVNWISVVSGPHQGLYCTRHCAARAEYREVTC